MATGLGGLLGLVVWYFTVVRTGLWPRPERDPQVGSVSEGAAALAHHQATKEYDRMALGSALVLVFSAGAAVLMVGEKLRVFPTQEQLDRQSRPVSLFGGKRDT